MQYKIIPISAARQGDEYFELELPDGSRHRCNIWDYDCLYRYPDFYRQLIVEFLECRVYEAIEGLIKEHLQPGTELRVADIACGSGLMGQRLRSSEHYRLSYLAGIEVSSTALTALNRDTPNVYDDCFLVGRDDRDRLRDKQLNCLIICGAASHMSEKDYDYYLSLLQNGGWIAFNLVADHEHEIRQEILNFLNDRCELVAQRLYWHRKLLNGEYIEHEAFLFRHDGSSAA